MMNAGGMGSMEQQPYQLSKLAVEDGGLYAGHDDVMREEKDGTTIMSIKYQGGILLGADSRTSNVSLAVQTLGQPELTMFFVLCGAGYVHR